MRAENVSNEQLLEDIKNTKKEYEAYCAISNAFIVLAQLPENIGNNHALSVKAVGYRSNAEQCIRFLQDLQELAHERGLDDSNEI